MKRDYELQVSLPNSLNQEVINEFLLNLSLLNPSHHTLYRYRLFLERFFEYVDKPFSTLTSDEIHNWFLDYGKNLKERTIRVGLSILSSFYKFCVEEEYIDRSPMKKRWYPRVPQSVPKYLEKEEIAITRQHSERATLRNQALFEFMISSGCRKFEVHNLNREDVDLENRTAWVKGKGKKVRQVHFTERCAVLLERYLESIPKDISLKPLPLFISKLGNRLSLNAMHEAISKIGKEVGLSTPLYPHRLRHTFATEMLSKGAELSFIAEELGHSNLKNTQIYARLPKREIVALYRKFMG